MLGNQRASRKVLILLCAMSFIMYIDRVNLSTAAGAMSHELGLSNTDLGLVFSSFGYSYTLFQLIGGWLGDRLGARLVLSVSGAIWAVTTFATGFVHGFTSLIVIRLLLGIGEGATLPSQARVVTDWFKADRRAFFQGVIQSFSRLGNALTPPLIAALMLAFSWRMSFQILGGATLLWVFSWAWYYRDDPRNHPEMTPVAARELPPLIEHEQASANSSTPWLKLFRRMSPTILVYFGYGWTASLLFAWLPIFFMNGRHLNIKSSALLSSAVFLAGVVGDTAGGLISDWLFRRSGDVNTARRNVVVISFGGALVSFVAVLTSQSLVTIACSLGVTFFFLELTVAPIWTIPTHIAPQHVGIASGMMNSGATIAGIISPIAFGFIVDKTDNWVLPFAGSMTFLAIGIVSSFFMRPDRPINSANKLLAIPPIPTT